jgi:phenylacetate-coenzyme A ligase PaaK-like adenylate-forming protein
VSAVPREIHEQIEALLAAPTFLLEPREQHSRLLAVLKSELAYAAERSAPFRRYLSAWPIDYQRAEIIADLPYLPVGVFKASPPLLLVQPETVVRTLASSATTGQTPSRVSLDAETSRRMVKGVSRIVGDFIGPQRRPYLIIDAAETLGGGHGELGARGAAIQGLRSFATEMTCCLKLDAAGDMQLDESKLQDFATRWRSTEVVVYGFTYVVWQHFVVPLRDRGIKLQMPNIRLLHSGGWKRLQDQAVTREAFASGVAAVFGCTVDRVLDFYGMVENVGVVYPDCELGCKHVPAFAGIIVRNPLTLHPVGDGEQGLVQVCSILPTSFPGFLVLTEDIAEVIRYDGCDCGRRGISFRFVKRVPKAEVRGCGNIETVRQRPSAAEAIHA